jgi:hypothetical protein
MTKRALRFVFIDDDVDSRNQWLEWGNRRNYITKAVEDVFEAVKINADFYIFDISAVAPIIHTHSAYSPICKLHELHPGGIIVIISGIPKVQVEEVCEDVERHCGYRPSYGGWGKFEDLEKAIQPYL